MNKEKQILDWVKNEKENDYLVLLYDLQTI